MAILKISDSVPRSSMGNSKRGLIKVTEIAQGNVIKQSWCNAAMPEFIH